jgi:hypothetical protein
MGPTKPARYAYCSSALDRSLRADRDDRGRHRRSKGHLRLSLLEGRIANAAEPETSAVIFASSADFLRATVVLLQHFSNFERKPHCRADCLVLLLSAFNEMGGSP